MLRCDLYRIVDRYQASSLSHIRQSRVNIVTKTYTGARCRQNLPVCAPVPSCLLGASCCAAQRERR